MLLVKLADRLHNMRTIEFMPTDEQKLRISRETLEIYAPLARRVGLSIFAGELEDLAFKVVNPEAFAAIEKRLEELVTDDTSMLDRIRSDIETVMLARGVRGELQGRMKRPYSIWRKLETKSISFKDLGDVFAYRLIVRRHRRLLSGAGRGAPAMGGAVGQVPRLHLRAEAERIPLAAHDIPRAEQPARRAADPHAGDGSHRRARRGGALEIQELAVRVRRRSRARGGPRRRGRTRGVRRHAEARRRAGGIPRARAPADVPRQRVRVHAEGTAGEAAGGIDAAGLRLCGPHRDRRHDGRREDQRHGAAAAHDAGERRHGRDPARVEAGGAAALGKPCGHRPRALGDPAADAIGGARRIHRHRASG